MIDRIAEILRISKEDDLKVELGRFEDGLRDILEPLKIKLHQTVLTSEVPQLELHMTYVESWRDRVAEYHALACAFVEHSKSDRFIVPVPTGSKITQLDRESYQRGLAGGFAAIRDYLDQLIRSVDSRVNLCKKLLGIEGDISNPGLRR